MSDQEEGFTVRDRRRFTTEETAPAAPAEAASMEAAPAEAAFVDEDVEFDEDALPQELPDVYTMIGMFLVQLRNLAWIRMGLVANPLTGTFERDLVQAKVAIDTVAFLASRLEPTVPAEERLPLRALVSDLQLNFVEQSKIAP